MRWVPVLVLAGRTRREEQDFYDGLWHSSGLFPDCRRRRGPGMAKADGESVVAAVHATPFPLLGPSRTRVDVGRRMLDRVECHGRRGPESPGAGTITFPRSSQPLEGST